MSQTRFKWMAGIRAIMNQFKTSGKDRATFIGQDNVGNKYYEAHRPNNPHIAKVPPAWDAWLRFRRPNPPTEEEMRESEEYFKNQQAMALERKTKEAAEKEKDKESDSSNSTTRKTQPREQQQGKKMPARRKIPEIPLER